jgi:hypothetical protein
MPLIKKRAKRLKQLLEGEVKEGIARGGVQDQPPPKTEICHEIFAVD